MLREEDSSGDNFYEHCLRKEISSQKELKLSYSPGDMNQFHMSGMMEVKDMNCLIGYYLALRDDEKGGKNFFVNDLLTLGEIDEGELEKVINFNEKFAKNLDCSGITVEGGDDEVKGFYEKKGYIFEEGEYIGFKELK